MTPSGQSVAVCICGNEKCDIAEGLCHCGCGRLSPLARQDDTKRGYKRGKPTRFIYGHQCIQRRPDVSGESPFEYDGEICRRIPLTQGQWAIVLAIHFDWLMQWLWWAQWEEDMHGYYAARRGHIDGKVVKIAMHRVVLGLPPGEIKNGDHKNGNTLDNRPRNLRPANDEENGRNRKMHCTNKSGFKGVFFHKASGKWAAQIRENGRSRWLGVFNTPEEAYAVYCAEARRVYGEFARLT